MSCALWSTNKTTEVGYGLNSLSNTKSYKYLGINLDQSLSLTEHFTSTFKKAIGSCICLRVRPHLTKQFTEL